MTSVAPQIAEPLGAASTLSSWDCFVLRHRQPGNLVVHFVSAIMFFVSPVVALATWNPWYLAAFFTSGMVGAFGHYAFKDSGVSLREATVAKEVPYYVLVMFYKIARGTYRHDIESAQARAACAR